VVIVSVFQRGKAGIGCQVLGSITWDVMWLVREAIKITWYVTWLIWERVKITQVDTTWNRARYNTWSQRRLEMRGEIATKSTIAERFFQREASCIQESDNNLYCTNRTSLENSFYATQSSIYTKRCRSYWNIVESNRRSEKVIEGHGSVWKSLENARTVHR